jgi:succinate dehydrogenase (ubiquinone) cytochrome b560 subunit
MSGFAIGMLALPGSFPYYFEMLQGTHFGPALIGSVKFLLAWPFVFHFANGIRHLAWDMGKGFENKEVSTTGWTVVGVSTLLAFVLACM